MHQDVSPGKLLTFHEGFHGPPKATCKTIYNRCGLKAMLLTVAKNHPQQKWKFPEGHDQVCFVHGYIFNEGVEGVRPGVSSWPAANPTTCFCK